MFGESVVTAHPELLPRFFTFVKQHGAMLAMGFSPYVDLPTNQQFFCLSKKEIEHISKFASFEIWAPCGPQQSVVRFVTSWNTSSTDIDEFISQL